MTLSSAIQSITILNMAILIFGTQNDDTQRNDTQPNNDKLAKRR
jgi:hypothetical protein